MTTISFNWEKIKRTLITGLPEYKRPFCNQMFEGLGRSARDPHDQFRPKTLPSVELLNYSLCVARRLTECITIQNRDPIALARRVWDECFRAFHSHPPPRDDETLPALLESIVVLLYEELETTA